MPDYITIDGGTTNTRIRIVSEKNVIDTLKFNIGARLGIDDKTILRKAVKNGIDEILKKNNMVETDIKIILASGMITSEFGLVNLPHITVPVGLKDLHNSMYKVKLDDISSIPFCFMRGVKTDCKDLEMLDIMRGEETELMGISKLKEGIYILPGSHSKIIKTDFLGRITDFKTSLTGEMISALTENTILKDAVNLRLHKLNKEYLIKGFEFCRDNGINQALFKIRILKNQLCENQENIYSFYMGVILASEVLYILSQNPKSIVLGGKKQIKEATAILLKEFSDTDIETIPEETSEILTSLGMINIYEHKC